MQLTKTTIQPKVTATGASVGSGASIGTITDDFTLILAISQLNTGNFARFAFVDSTDGFSSDKEAGPTVSVEGGISPSAPVRYSWQKGDFPNLRLGVGGARLRLELSELTGSPKSATFEAWIETGG